jgi:hypothetical protein
VDSAIIIFSSSAERLVAAEPTAHIGYCCLSVLAYTIGAKRTLSICKYARKDGKMKVRLDLKLHTAY